MIKIYQISINGPTIAIQSKKNQVRAHRTIVLIAIKNENNVTIKIYKNSNVQSYISNCHGSQVDI